MSYKYERPYYLSKRTDDMVDRLPSWMKMREPESVGYRFLNALYSGEADWGEVISNRLLRSSNIIEANVSEVSRVYKTYHSEIINTIPVDVIISGYINTTRYTITEADDLDTFLSAPPTRFGLVATGSPAGLTDNILGLSHMVNYYSSGSWPMRDGDLYDRVAISRDSDLLDTDKASIVFYRWPALDEIVATGDWVRGIQSYDAISIDERMDIQEDGRCYFFEHSNIVTASLAMYDYANLTGDGLPSSFTFSSQQIKVDSIVGMSALDEGGWDPVTSQQEGYDQVIVAKYVYKKGDQGGPITMVDNWGYTGRWTDKPITTLSPHTSYRKLGGREGTIPFRFASSQPTDGIALTCSSLDLRPGATGIVEVAGLEEIKGTWASPLSAGLRITSLSSLPGRTYTGKHYFRILSPDGFVQIEDEDYIVYPYGPYNRSFYVVGTGVPDSSTYTLTYETIRSWSIQATGSLDQDRPDDDAYPLDWEYIDWEDKQYVAAKSVLVVIETDPTYTTIWNGILESGSVSTIRVYPNVDWKGAFYNYNTEQVHLFDRNNMMFHMYDTSPYVAFDRKVLTYMAPQSRATIVPSGGDGNVYPFLNTWIVSGYYPGPCEMIGDHICMWIDASGTTQLDIINAFNYWGYGPTGSYGMTLPGIPSDMTISTSGSILFGIDTNIVEAQPYYDYMMVDRDDNIVYYRERYDSIEGSGV